VAAEARDVRVLVTGACGFVGSTLIRTWVAHGAHTLVGLDNFVRPGSEQNRAVLRALGVPLYHADIRLASDVDGLPPSDVVIDAAANPTVLAGVDGQTSSRQLVEHNLVGTVNVLEYCRAHRATLVMLSTSRVYALEPLAGLRVRVANDAYVPDTAHPLPTGLTPEGIDERFSTASPVSLYGATKIASEQLALEYGSTYGFPVWINRCGVLAGGGQFGRPDQGIFAFWVNSWLQRRPLQYIGFGGRGYQVRDCLHPEDVAPLIDRQIASHDAGVAGVPRVVNVGGGVQSARSLAQLSAWCRDRLGEHPVEPAADERPFDVPWMVLDSSLAKKVWNWAPSRTTETILEEILSHAEGHPDWLDITGRPPA
jgi:CDP-paratose 2-epimerase